MPSSVVNDLATTFQIKELTGDQRTLVLRDRALPYRPFELSGSQRNTIEWYPGSPIGTLQVYGSKEETTVCNGQWKDKFLAGSAGTAPAEVGRADTIGVQTLIDDIGQSIQAEVIDSQARVLRTAIDLCTLVDDIRRKGQEIEVTWLNQVRRGIIERFTTRWETGHDVAWEIAFVWISQGESLSDIAFKSDASDLADLPNKMQSLMDEEFAAEAAVVPQAGDRFADINGALQEAGAELQRLTDDLTDMVVQASATITAPGEAVRRAVGILDGLKLTAELWWEIACDTADGVSLDLTELLSFGEVLAQRGELRERAGAANEMRNLAAREQAKLLSSLNADVIRVFQARDGQDLREVSLTFFGTPDEWRSLMLFNNLTTSQLSAGQVVFVPQRPSGDDC